MSDVMITLYIRGTALKIDGVWVDYIVVSSESAAPLMAAGWVEKVDELKNI